MARDSGLEELVRDELQAVSGITEKAMFGGWAFLLHGNLLCGARAGSLLVRLGKGRDAWALRLAGVEPMVMRGRALEGWLRASPQAYGNDRQRRKLVQGAVEFVQTLPKKVGSAREAGEDDARTAKPRRPPTASRAAAPATVDGYLAALDPSMRKALSSVRGIVRAAVPEAVESISYGIPTYKLHGKPLIYFGAGKGHCALYGVPYLPELAKYDTSGKGTLRFAPDKPPPATLIRKLLAVRRGRITPVKRPHPRAPTR